MSGVRLVVNFHARPGHGDDYAEAWAPRFDEVDAEPGCLQYELFRSTVNPDNLALLEWWDSREAFDRHWRVERQRKPVGREYVGGRDDRAHGQDTSEIYWEQQSYRFDVENDIWVPRSV